MLVAIIAKTIRNSAFFRRLSDLKTIVRTAWAWHRRARPRIKRDRISYAIQLSNSTPVP